MSNYVGYVFALLVIGIVVFFLFSETILVRSLDIVAQKEVAILKSNATHMITRIPLSHPNIRWNQMPLKIWFNLSKVPEDLDQSYMTDFREAANRLSTDVNQKIAFAFVTSNPDIEVKWVDKLSANATDAVGNTLIKFITVDDRNVINGANIEFLTNFEGRKLGNAEMTNLALHELGHALGLDHVEDKTSVMYPRVNKDVLQLSSADKETLISVYSEEALPDLIIETAKFSKKATGGRFFRQYYLDGNFTITNIGIIDLSNFIFEIRADSEVIQREGAKLKIGESITYNFQNLHASNDFQNVTILVDPENIIKEYIEENNLLKLILE